MQGGKIKKNVRILLVLDNTGLTIKKKNFKQKNEGFLSFWHVFYVAKDRLGYPICRRWKNATAKERMPAV
jgi:hypothetical protein